MKVDLTHDLYLVAGPIKSFAKKYLSSLLDMLDSPILPLHHVGTNSVGATSTSGVVANKSLKNVAKGSNKVAVPQISLELKVKFKSPAKIKSMCNSSPLSAHFF